jgi:hypothetical protein
MRKAFKNSKQSTKVGTSPQKLRRLVLNETQYQLEILLEKKDYF